MKNERWATACNVGRALPAAVGEVGGHDSPYMFDVVDTAGGDRNDSTSATIRFTNLRLLMSNVSQNKAQGASSGTEAKSALPEIHAAEKHRRYKLIDLENNEVERTALEIVEGSKLCMNRDLWVANFRATITRVRQWCQDRQDLVRMALVEVRSNKVLFYFVPRSDRYDLKLGDEMTALEVELGGSAGIGYVESLQVPERSLDRFAGQRSQLVWSSPPVSVSA